MKSAKNVKASPTELSSRNRSLLGIYSAQMETAADNIISGSSSRSTQRQALLFKTEGIPAMQVSLLNPDPVAAILDSWVFIFQMRGYMERPDIKQAFGQLSPIIDETLNNMDAEMEQLVRMAAPAANLSDLRKRAVTWATNHPIRAGLSGRQSVDPDLIRIVGETDLRIGALLQNVNEQLGNLTARLDAYSIYLPKQARWQAELLATDISQDPQAKEVGSNLMEVSGALTRTATHIDGLPDVIKKARSAVTADVDAQRQAAQTFLRDERIDTFADLHQERVATIAELRNERLAATEDLRGERREVFEGLNNQEQLLTRDLDAISAKAIQDFDIRSRSLIDHLFLRALELVLITIALCFLLVLISIRWIVKRYAERRLVP